MNKADAVTVLWNAMYGSAEPSDLEEIRDTAKKVLKSFGRVVD